MRVKSLFLLFVLSIIEADLVPITSSRLCPYPTFKHGRFRIRQRSKLIKFMCFPGYELVGNKYATCRNGEWDEPLPVCVRPGCAMSVLQNGIQWKLRNGAWLVSFCLPGYDLVGPSAIYCDGVSWNGTFPTCVESKAPVKLSCDFEEPSLCGWSHDELHDFDWKRLNRRTPSSFLKTGPSYDHTLGEGQAGYYMYVESTSRMQNDTARLISPVYDETLATNGCFSFYYHMFGKSMGGLRVYQKPDNLPLQTLVALPDVDRQAYVLFEKWGNQDDVWFRDVSKLSNFSDNFQIVIEGIRGSSFTSDIAIDDVAILQGDNCTVFLPKDVAADSCADRCDLVTDSRLTPNFNVSASTVCGCNPACLYADNCCTDFFEVCIFPGSSPGDDTTPAEVPQTQKLVASTLNTTTNPPTTSSTTAKPTTTSTTAKPTTKPTAKPTTKPTAKPTTKSTTKRVTSTKPTFKPNTTLVFKSSTPIYNATGIIHKDVKNETIVVKPTTTTLATTVVTKKAIATTGPYLETSRFNDGIKLEKEKAIEAKGLSSSENEGNAKTNSGLKTSIVTITALLCCAGAVWLAVSLRGARGRALVARMRGRVVRDPEVRYLNADVDDD